MTIYALVTEDGTAASESALCEDDYTPANKNYVYGFVDLDVLADSWRDCSGNDELHCQLCGIDNRGKGRDKEAWR